ncbi:MAG: hypothetical protein H7Y41_07255 [Hyphomonadaceae bacterium]|nr:hypothetical protein [Clostridia bacterium]
MATAITISTLTIGPTEQEVMQYMAGMMGSMQSLMGLSMTLEGDGQLGALIALASSITIPLIVISIIVALIVRLNGGEANDR